MKTLIYRLVLVCPISVAACADDDALDFEDTEGGSGSTSDASTSTTTGATSTLTSTSTATDTGTTTSETDTGATIAVTENISLYPTQPMVVDLELLLSAPADVEIAHTFDEGVTIQELDGSDTSHRFRLRGLAPATVHGIDYAASGAEGSAEGTVEFTTQAPLRGFRPSFEVTGAQDPTDPEYRLIDLTVFPSAEDTSLFFVDPQGITRWHYGTAGVQPLRPESIAGAAKLLADGTVAYLHGLDFYVRDELNTEVLNLTYADLEAEGLHHEVLVLPNGNFMALSFTFRTENVPGEGMLYVVGDEVIEFTGAGDVVWRWNSFDHLDPGRIRESYFPPNTAHPDTGELAHDWTHGNGIEYDPVTETMLVSLRHQDWVINIDHETGDVLWRLGEEGDFTLVGGDTWFFHQHSPQWQSDGSILLYDNAFGNPAVPTVDIESRAVRYELDYDAMTATQVWEDDADPFGAVFAGDADVLPSGRYLVLDSSVQDPPGMGPIHSRLRELEPDDSPQQQWSLETGDGAFIYRATAQDYLPGEPQG